MTTARMEQPLTEDTPVEAPVVEQAPEQPQENITPEPAVSRNTVITPEVTPDVYAEEEDPSIDPYVAPEPLPPTDTTVNNLSAMGAMSAIAEGDSTGVYGAYQQTKVMAERNPDAVKDSYRQFLQAFDRQTTEVLVGQADPEIVADKIQEDAKQQESMFGAYVGAATKAYPTAPRSMQEKIGARLFAMEMLSEYMEGYSGWSVAGDILKSMIPGVAYKDILDSNIKPETIEAVKMMSGEDQAKFFAAVLPFLDEAYDQDKTFVAQVFSSFLDIEGAEDLATYQNLEKLFLGLDAATIFTGAAKMIRGGQVVKDVKKINKVLAGKVAASGIKDQTGELAKALNMTRDELVQSGLPWRNDVVEGMDHLPNVPEGVEQLAPIDMQQIQAIRDGFITVLSDDLTLAPQLLRQGEVAGAMDRITKETQKKITESLEGTPLKTGSIRVTKKEGEDVFVVNVDVLGPVDVRTGKLGNDEFEALVETLDIPAKQKKALMKEFDEGGDPQQIIDDFVGNTKVVQEGIQSFRTSRTTTLGTIRTETFEARPTLDDYGSYAIKQDSMFDYALSPVEKLDRELVAGAELLASTQERVAAQLGEIYKFALSPVSGLRNRAARKNVENAYELWERANKVEYDAAGNIIKSGQNVRPSQYQLAYEGITAPDGSKIYLRSQAEQQAFYNLANIADGFYLIGNKLDLQRLKATGVKQIAINEGMRGWPRLTEAQVSTTLKNLDENAMVFDTVRNISIPKAQVAEALQNSDNVLVSMYDALKTKDGMFSVAIVPRNAVSELGPYQRARRNLYSPKINLGVRGVVFEVKDGVLNGVTKAATDPANPNRKAVRFARGVKEGEKIAEELNQQAPDGVRYIFQEDTVDPLSGELRSFNQTGLYRGARSKDEIMIGLEETSVETVPVYEAMARNLQHLSNQYPMNEWRMATQQRFINSVNSTAANDAQKIKAFDDTIPDSHPMKDSLENMKDYIRQQLKVPSKQETVYEKRVLQLADWVEGKGLTQASQTVMRLKDTNLTAKLRGLTFHSLLGMFNPAQLWMQAQSASIAISMHPWFATKGLPRAMAMRFGLYADDEALQAIAKRAKLDVDDYVSMVKNFRRTGLHQSVRNNADFDAAIQGYTLSGRAFKGFLDKGLMFYRQGEISARVFSWEIATQRYMQQTGKKISRFTDDDWREIFKQQQNITLNMSSANKAGFQQGIAGVATQFWQVTTKFAETVFRNGREFTVGERVRMLVGQAALYGAVGIPAGRWLVDTAAGFFEVDPEEVTEEQLTFITQGIVGFLSDGQLDLSARSAINKGLEDMVFGFFEGEFTPVETLLGASFSLVERGSETLMFFEPLLFRSSEDITTTDLAALIGKGLVQIPSSIRNASQAVEAARKQQFIDRNHRVIFEDPTWIEIAGKFAGFTPNRQIIQYEVFKDVQAKEKYLNDRAARISNLYMDLMEARGLFDGDPDLDKAESLLQAVFTEFAVDYEANPRDAHEIRKRVVNRIRNPKTKEEQILLDLIRNGYRGDKFLNEAVIREILREAQ